MGREPIAALKRRSSTRARKDGGIQPLRLAVLDQGRLFRKKSERMGQPTRAWFGGVHGENSLQAGCHPRQTRGPSTPQLESQVTRATPLRMTRRRERNAVLKRRSSTPSEGNAESHPFDSLCWLRAGSFAKNAKGWVAASQKQIPRTARLRKLSSPARNDNRGGGLTRR